MPRMKGCGIVRDWLPRRLGRRTAARLLVVFAITVAPVVGNISATVDQAGSTNSVWETAEHAAAQHRFSTLFTAQDVRRYLSSAEGLETAIDWCKKTAVTKVYIETFRDAYQAERPARAWRYEWK